MSTRSLKLSKHEPLGTIALNRPEQCNALDLPMIDELLHALDDFHREKSVRAVALTGVGRAFCSGLDLAQLRSTGLREDSYDKWHDMASRFGQLIEQILRYPKPIIAVVNGPALAGGAGLVLASDLAIAEPGAEMGLPAPRRGLVAGGVAPLLTFRVGGGRAAQLLLTGTAISAESAFQWGIYSELVGPDLAWARARELAAQCAECSPEALQMTKRMLNETVGEQLFTHLATGAAVTAASCTTEAAAEGIAAFLDKRTPHW